MAEKPLKPGQIQVAGSTVLVNADGQVVRFYTDLRFFSFMMV